MGLVMVNQIAIRVAPPSRTTTVAERNSMEERLLLVLIVRVDPNLGNRAIKTNGTIEVAASGMWKKCIRLEPIGPSLLP